MKRILLPITAVAVTCSMLLLGGCVPPPQKPQLTPLQIQAMQTKSYHAPAKQVYTAMLGVLQDEGYIVKTANYDSDIITAQSPTHTNQNEGTFGQRFGKHLALSLLGNDDTQEHPDNVITNDTLTATLQPQPNGITRVRISITADTQTSSHTGQTGDNVQPIYDAQMYQKVFNRLTNALFVLNSGKSTATASAEAPTPNAAPAKVKTTAAKKPATPAKA